MPDQRNIGEGVRAVATNGVGNVSYSHLNRTRSLADVWGVEPVIIAPVAAIEAAPSHDPNLRYRLRSPAGLWMHQSAQGLTSNQEYAWLGDAAQLRKVRAALPIAADLKTETVWGA